MEFKSKLLCNSRACPSRLCSQKAETCDKQRVHEFRFSLGLTRVVTIVMILLSRIIRSVRPLCFVARDRA